MQSNVYILSASPGVLKKKYKDNDKVVGEKLNKVRGEISTTVFIDPGLLICQ